MAKNFTIGLSVKSSAIGNKSTLLQTLLNLMGDKVKLMKETLE